MTLLAGFAKWAAFVLLPTLLLVFGLVTSDPLEINNDAAEGSTQLVLFHRLDHFGAVLMEWYRYIRHELVFDDLLNLILEMVHCPPDSPSRERLRQFMDEHSQDLSCFLLLTLVLSLWYPCPRIPSDMSYHNLNLGRPTLWIHGICTIWSGFPCSYMR